MGLDIQSKEVIDKISDELKLQPSLQIPKELMDKIQLIYNVNPPKIINFIKPFVQSDGTGGTIFATPNDRDTFLVGYQLSVAKDAVNTATFVQLKAFTPLGINDAFAMIKMEPLTAAEHILNADFSFPMKIKRGTNIIINSDNGTASIDLFAVLYFIQTDPQ